jgi:hypothetical protein
MRERNTATVDSYCAMEDVSTCPEFQAVALSQRFSKRIHHFRRRCAMYLIKLNNYVQWVFCGAAENERGSEGAEGAARHRA